MDSNHTPKQTIPLWKWILELVLGSILTGSAFFGGGLGISALIFGFAHIINRSASIWSSVAIAIEAGVLLGAAYKYTNSLWFPIGIHWAWNFTQGNVFGFAVSGGDIEESILTGTLSGPDIITGGSFGLEASIISLILGTILSTFYLWKILKSQHL